MVGYKAVTERLTHLRARHTQTDTLTSPKCPKFDDFDDRFSEFRKFLVFKIYLIYAMYDELRIVQGETKRVVNMPLKNWIIITFPTEAFHCSNIDLLHVVVFQNKCNYKTRKITHINLPVLS